MNEVIRYDAVHLRYEESNIKYGAGCEIEVVKASDYATLQAECRKLRAELAAIKEQEPAGYFLYDPIQDQFFEVDPQCACDVDVVPLYALPAVNPQLTTQPTVK